MKKIICALGLVVAFTIANPSDVHAQTTKVKSRSGKNAAIGAGVGAVTGAAVSRKKGKGAIIGGAAGATAGYIWGKHKDRKKGKKVVTKG